MNYRSTQDGESATSTLWAKTGPAEDPANGLSLPQHMRDSGLVAEYIWDHWIAQGVKDALCQLLDITLEQTKALYCWLAETHDIGKASPEFAGQLDARNNDELRIYKRKIEQAGFQFPSSFTPPTCASPRCPHSAYGQSILVEWLTGCFGEENDSPQTLTTAALTIASISGAHHGAPAKHQQNDDMRRDITIASSSDPIFTQWQEAWLELLDRALEHSGAEEVLERLMSRRTKLPITAQFILTGLVIMADWIASNPDYFPMGKFTDAEHIERARQGWEALGFEKAWEPTLSRSDDARELYSSRFQWFKDNPEAPLRPMQEVAVEAARSLTHGGMMCIEAPMGQGKTEAGLIAAEILVQTTGRSGLVFAAPTQATTNALLSRIQEWAHSALGSTTDIHSLFLGHSKRNLNKDMKSIPTLDVFDEADSNSGHYQADNYSRVARHSWLSGTKRGMLSTFVVCTIDQVLMMALQMKHVMLRHVALSSKVIIIDEVHAYDAYMSEYLKEALYWLGSMNAPVILMSATLPAETKATLFARYKKGQQSLFRTLQDGQVPKRKINRFRPTTVHAPVNLAYPVITTQGAEDSAPKLWDVEAPAEQQTITLRQISDDFEALREALSPIERGHGCAAIICNTVGRAQEVYDYLHDIYGEDITLFHSRFLAFHRVSKEEELVQKLGKDAHRHAGRPERRIVVGTQVIEQSLDLDFDVMVTDFAPVDLVLQRIGRLHRHARDESERPAEFRTPICYIRGLENPGDSEQAPEFIGVSTLIYESLILYTSYAQLLPYLRGEYPLQIPADVSTLVQGAYNIPEKGIPEDIPASWTEQVTQACVEYKKTLKTLENKAQGYLLKHDRQARTMADIMSAISYPHPMPRQTTERVGDEELGEMRVRDIDDSLEVIALEVERDEVGNIMHYRAIPENTAANQQTWFDVNTPLSNKSLAYSFAAATIRLPYQFADKPTRGSERGTSWRFDKALAELESFRIDAWQDEYLLRGQLILPFVYDEQNQQYTFDLVDYTLIYTQELGLQAIKKDK
ncbi:MAG: CRISPR-associated helicase Cas3' [Rothia sp. (in: high G+C Gram-positive bacteria)]|uniref:CRISPR-associated helicase Cas3' n=1 Tax=Rothia sp. (in: high G+C Gram-positive bacteria) TaxID=1885016 RepID=UPI0026E0A953|nr:CRISPR-associated helicase Cas3' [Rothia sp. (in: high G+C Gram-positive bacteria)]MDO5750831.1 CRISPR-associated helicase Cas3' [Rothia sp. (in: high G+C Gram-positive bacteria)]